MPRRGDRLDGRRGYDSGARYCAGSGTTTIQGAAITLPAPSMDECRPVTESDPTRDGAVTSAGSAAGTTAGTGKMGIAATGADPTGRVNPNNDTAAAEATVADSRT